MCTRAALSPKSAEATFVTDDEKPRKIENVKVVTYADFERKPTTKLQEKLEISEWKVNKNID